MKNNIRSALVNLLANTLGNVLVFFSPKKAARLKHEGLTVIMKDHKLSFRDRLMRRAILKKVEKRNNPSQLSKLHDNYWINQGHLFFSATENELQENHLPRTQFIFNTLKNKISESQTSVKTLVEIGSGNGIVLDYLSNHFNTIENFIGIDLSEIQTEKNNEKYKDNTRLKFVADDGFEWFKKQGHDNMVLVTFRGVLEYFTEEKLQNFFNYLGTLKNILIVTIEPICANHNLEKQKASQVYGAERSFSHNYPHLLKKSGFKIWHHSKHKEEGFPHFMSFNGASN